MESEELEELQFIAESVGFLDNCFDNSFVVQNSLVAVKEYTAEENNRSYSKAYSQRNIKSKPLFDNSVVVGVTSKNESLTQCQALKASQKNELKNWGLPQEIVLKYEDKGIREMFDWQVSCLANSKVLLECSNLVYSAPTSAGKTLVAEIITIKTVLERQKKVLIILPFVSIVREKMFYLQDILSSCGVRVEGFVGSQSPPGGLQAVHIAICTIEKANSLVNRLLDDGNIGELGAVIVDELHLLGDPHRGYILELLLTKIKYISNVQANTTIQIVGMSATLPNLEVLANWLNAELFVTTFRPIPLDEYCLVGNQYYDKQGQCVNVGNYYNLATNDNILNICLSTIKEGCSVLIFCMTKNRCETLAQNVASSFCQFGNTGNDVGIFLREQLNTEKITEVLEQLKNCPVGLDKVLKNTISFGVAYHHAGLTFDERDIIEGGFKSGSIRVLVATSTLSSGVNLPARKVIIRTPVFHKKPINILTYKQMIGRAGRMGKDVKGESILMCTEAEKNIGFQLMFGALDPVESCIESEEKYMRAILEMIASQDFCTASDLEMYSRCTLLFALQSNVNAATVLLHNTLKSLVSCELVRQQKEEGHIQYVATSLGKACLSSSMAPHDGISLFCELQKARQCLVLETDLHLIYLVTPYSVSSQWADIDWLHMLTLWESLTKAMKKVGELVGVQESFIIRSLRGANKSNFNATRLNVHKRFYTALALQDLVNEVPLVDVATKFQCARGFLQSLQQGAAMFAGMVTAFCRQLSWKNMEMLISQFQDRLHFGIHSELLELMKLTTLNGKRARALYDLGFETIFSVASADVNSIENALLKAVPFQSEKEREDDDNDDLRKRNRIKNVWITGCCGITTKEAAVNLITEARNYLKYEIGATEIKWDNKVPENNRSISERNISQADLCCIENKANKIVSITKETNTHVESKDHEIVISVPLGVETEVKYNKPLEVEDTVKANSLNSRETLEVKHDLSSTPLVSSTIEWGSLNFTDGAIVNITRGRMSDNIFSPNVSLSDNEDKDACTVTETSTLSKHVVPKDENLFSSEADSMFEESLPIDLISSKLLEVKDAHIATISVTKDSASSTVQALVNSESLGNAFKSTLMTFSDDEDDDIKLVYDDENKLSENEFDIGFNLSEDVIYTQEVVVSPLKTTAKSPCKRLAESNYQQHAAKMMRLSEELFLENNENRTYSLQAKSINIILKNHSIKCYILRGTDVLKNINYITTLKEAIICIKMHTQVSNAKIGRNIVKDIKSSEQVELRSHELNNISICMNDGTCIVVDVKSIAGDDKEKAIRMLGSWLSNNETKFKVLSLKSTLTSLRKLGLEIPNCEDISLTEWFIDSNERAPTIVYLVKKYGDIDLTATSINVHSHIKKFSSLEELEYLCVSAWCLRLVAAGQQRVLSEQFPHYEQVMKTQLLVLRILLDSECEGLTVNKELVSKLLMDVKNAQETLQKKAFSLCGYHFNFNSSQDVAKVLGMYRGRKVSTKKCILESINTPMANIIVYWRKLNAILTKTLYPLTEKARINNESNRIHPSYTMFTSTGRVSMHEPNLQNIPRTFSIPRPWLPAAAEFNCRDVVAAAPGCVLVAADYCQLEMRILAHLTADPVLTRIMHSDEDIFTTLATMWTGLDHQHVDEEVRGKTKQVVYGLAYGMSTRTLAQQLGAEEAAAARLRARLLQRCPALAAAPLLQRCRRRRAAATLLGRRRDLPALTSNRTSERNAAERRAVNTSVQGSAADITAAALCRVHDRTRGAAQRARLLLHLHDELLYELPHHALHDFVALLRDAMEHTVPLDVPLPVKVKWGYTWGSMTQYTPP